MVNNKIGKNPVSPGPVLIVPSPANSEDSGQEEPTYPVPAAEDIFPLAEC